MNKKIITLVMLLSAAGLYNANAQYDPLFTQYMFNEMFINPAYAGSRNAISSTALYRSQWQGIEGAPETQTLSIHGPIRNKKIGLGLSVMNESIGVEKKVGVFTSYAYRLQTGNESHLSMGLQAGLINVRENYLDVIEHDEGDPQFSQNVQAVVPNLGFGLYLSNPKYFAGLSIPRLIDNYIDPNDGVEIKNRMDIKTWHYFLTAGYVFKLNENVQLKPMTMIKASDGATMQFDISMAAYFREIFWLGGTYRTGDASAAFVQVNITKQLRLGYSYDYTMSKLNRYSSGSHEITLGYDIPLKKTGVLTPRYF